LILHSASIPAIAAFQVSLVLLEDLEHLNCAYNVFAVCCWSQNLLTIMYILNLLHVQVSLVLLEEPEHLNWYRAGSRWSNQFR
jgi:hypothetical protein